MRFIQLVSAFVVLAPLAVVGQAQRAAASGSALDVVQRFNDAINRHDPAAVAALLTDDTVFENTAPAPDGTRIAGKAAVAAYWEKWFVSNPDAKFDAEDVVVAGDRVTVQWIYRKMRDGKPWHLRGMDLLTVRDGKIAAKLAYVKG